MTFRHVIKNEIYLASLGCSLCHGRYNVQRKEGYEIVQLIFRFCLQFFRGLWK